VVRRNVAQVNSQDVRDRDLLRVAATGSSYRSFVLPGDILGETTFGSAKIACRAARALLVASVPDDVDGRVRDAAIVVVSRASEIEAGAFASSRHNSLIRLMYASVV
jgi:hypothetical protein